MPYGDAARCVSRLSTTHCALRNSPLCHQSVILSLLSWLSVLGFVVLHCLQALEETMTFAEAVGECHFLHDGGTVVGIQFELPDECVKVVVRTGCSKVSLPLK